MKKLSDASAGLRPGWRWHRFVNGGLNGRRCNASVTSGCGRPSRARAVGSQPFGIAVNPRTRTVYVTQLFQAGSMALLKSGQR